MLSKDSDLLTEKCLPNQLDKSYSQFINKYDLFILIRTI